MNKKIIIIPIVVAIAGFTLSSLDNEEKSDNTVFHVTLADPKMFQEGVYTDVFSIDSGQYSFRFVPNGDSPQLLSILLNGESFSFDEGFKLNGTSHETGISQYYTWDYDGMKEITISEDQEVTIQINPNGNLLGSVSVDLIRN